MLKEMLNYTAKADAIIISILEQKNLPEANKLFSHVLNAQNVWAKRMLDQQPDFTVWQNSKPTDFQFIAANNFKLIWEAFNTIPLDKEINYTNTGGETFTNKMSDILLHICNHSTYHRAQIATILRKAGFEPPVTDYIMMKRTNQL